MAGEMAREIVATEPATEMAIEPRRDALPTPTEMSLELALALALEMALAMTTGQRK